MMISARAIEEKCMNKLVKVSDLTIGDWLVRPVKVGRKSIKPNWEGLSEKEWKLIVKKYKVAFSFKHNKPC